MNITAFMNLMVVLVPFLLISAVFSRLTILQLNLPGEVQPQPAAQQPREIEIIVRSGGIQVADRGTGLLKALPATPRGHDLRGLTEYLQLIKAKFPQKTDATVLLEPDTSYDTLVQVMDAVRSVAVPAGGERGRLAQAELFPDISIGDAPI